MAGDLGVLSIAIKVGLDQLDKDLDTARGKAKDAGEDVGKGVSKGAEAGFDKAGKAASGWEDKLANIGDQATKKITPIAGAVAVATTAMSQSWNNAQKDMQATTGATGAELEGLMASVQNVTGTVKGGAGAIGDVMADLAARTGMSGPPLEDLTRRLMALKEMGISLAAADVTGAFGRWGIKAQEMAGALERVNKVAQATGQPLGVLLGRLNQFQPVLQGLGFSFEDASLLVGRLSDVSLVGLKKALDGIVDTGTTDVPGAFATMIASIKEAESPTAGLAMAIESFGMRAGPELYAQISKGKFGLEDLRAAVAENTGDSIKAAEANRTWLDQLGLFKDKAAAMLGPYAEKISLIASGVAAIGPAAEGIGKGISWIKQLGDGADTAKTAVDGVGAVTGLLGPKAMAAGAGLTVQAGATTAAGAASAAAAPGFFAAAAGILAVTWPILAVIAAVGALVGIFWFLTEQLGLSTESAVKIMLFLLGPFGLIINTLWFLWENWDKIWGWLTDRTEEAVGLISDIFGGIGEAIGDVASFVWDKLKAAWDWIVTKAKEIIEFAGKAGDAIKGMAGDLAGAAFDITPVGMFGNITGLFEKGGVVPGAPGTPQLIVAHGGETILPTSGVTPTEGVTLSSAERSSPGGGLTVVYQAQGHIIRERDAARDVSRTAAELRRSGFAPAR